MSIRNLRLLVCAVSMLGFVACGDDDPNPVPSSPAGQGSSKLLALHARRGVDAGIYDSRGRRVLLRGVNVNALGDYYQGNINYPPVLSVDDGDFAEMARYGLNVVRLILSWSLLEPQPNQISQDYLRRIREVLQLAKAHDVYVILDMHQDAWGKYIATPPGATCSSGREIAIGWDGAPAWATITDGALTCRPPGSRELAPAVKTAFINFYGNRQGIRDHFVAAWAALVREFAQEPAIAGYDLLNEPHFGSTVVGSGSQLGPLYSQLIPAIRNAESEAGGFAHVIFFEPVVLYPSIDAMPPVESIGDDNVVFAPHNYAESINDVTTIEGWFDRANIDVGQFQSTYWVGEYGWISDPPVNKAKLIRYAKQEDRYLLGGAWWQWQQACGDPHSIGVPGREPASQLIHFRLSRCPGDIDLGPIPEWTVVLSRAFPRAAPGLRSLVSDGDSRTATLEGEVAVGAASSTIDLWVPNHGKGIPTIGGRGIVGQTSTTVDGGFRCAIDVSGSYEVHVQ